MHGLRLCESRGRDPGDRHDNARAHRFPGADFLSGYNDDTGAHRHARRDRYDRPGRYACADG